MSTVLAFGTFDRFDAGHAFFLDEAAELGDRLVVGVARDEHVKQLKGKPTVQDEQTRLSVVASYDGVDEARLSDAVLGSYEIIRDVRPDLVAVGFDQAALVADIERWSGEQNISVSIRHIAQFQMTPFKEVKIAVAIATRDGKILMLQRRDKNPMWDRKWEFPGGKIEGEESADVAIGREVREETGLEVRVQKFVGIHLHDWHLPNKILRVHIHCFHCEVDAGEVVLEERAAYQSCWASPEEALQLDSLAANADILKKFLSECVNV